MIAIASTKLVSLFLLYLNQYQIMTLSRLRLVTEACLEEGWPEKDIAGLPEYLKKQGISLHDLWDQICADRVAE